MNANIRTIGGSIGSAVMASIVTSRLEPSGLPGRLARTDGYGLHELLRAFGRSFAEHARYANLLLQRQPDVRAASKLRQAVRELTSRAVSAGTVHPGITADDVLTLVSAMRGLIHTVPGGTPDAWQRFLGIHLAGMTVPAAE